MEFKLVVTEQYDGREIRDIMSKELQMSRNMIKKCKLYGTVELNGVHARVIDPAHTGDVLLCAYADDSGMLRQDTGINIVYEDEYLAVVDKPAGMVTHPTHGHLDDSLLTMLSNSELPLHPVMRLDRETSGLLIIAKNGYTHNAMKNANIQKKYLAAVYGIYDHSEGTINAAIRRRPNSIMIRDICPDSDPEGHPSITHYKTLLVHENANTSLMEFTLETGRCHQIRVHSLSQGHPLIGDGLYGPNSVDNPCDDFENATELDALVGRQCLHAYSLSFYHPILNQEMAFVSDLPEDIRRVFPEFDLKSVRNK